MRHIRHIGNGLLVLFDGEKEIREIGITPGWDFKDRDEVISSFNKQIEQNNSGLLNLLDKKYDGEAIYDATRDFAETFDEAFTPALKQIPKDEYHIQKGKFRVLVTWEPDDDS